jgi:hypothetical protein
MLIRSKRPRIEDLKGSSQLAPYAVAAAVAAAVAGSLAHLTRTKSSAAGTEPWPTTRELMATTDAAQANRELVADQLAATAGEDRNEQKLGSGGHWVYSASQPGYQDRNPGFHKQLDITPAPLLSFATEKLLMHNLRHSG